MKKYKFLIFLAILGSILEGITYSGLSFLLKDVIDEVFIEKNLEKLKFVVFSLIIIVIFRQIGLFLKSYAFPYASYKMLFNLRKQMFDKLVNTSAMAITSKNLGDIISRFTSDIEALRNNLYKIGVDLISNFFVSVFMLGVLIYLDWKMFTLILFIFPLLTLSLSFFGKFRQKYSKKLQETLAEYTQFISQIIQGFELIKLFNKDFVIKKFESVNKNLFKNQYKSTLFDVVYLSSVEVISYSMIAIIIFYGGYRIIKGEITTGEFFAFLGALVMLVNSVQFVYKGLINIKVIKPIISRILQILDLSVENDSGKKFKGLKNKIEYKNVNLKIGDNHILKDINLTVNKKDKVAIVGLTGSGKSTLVKLLPALVKGYKGKIEIDGISLNEYSISSLRKHIGMISQEVFIFNDTLRNNLLIAKPEASDEELLDALKRAKANFIKKLENGLDTILGEKGARLSGGERQRISIARIFLKNPDIIIIDEGTSALDIKTEEYIMNEIKTYFKDKTILMITHRLSTLDIANKIVVMENGKIIETGSLNELLEKKGAFYRFYTLSKDE